MIEFRWTITDQLYISAGENDKVYVQCQGIECGEPVIFYDRSGRYCESEEFDTVEDAVHFVRDACYVFYFKGDTSGAEELALFEKEYPEYKSISARPKLYDVIATKQAKFELQALNSLFE